MFSGLASGNATKELSRNDIVQSGGTGILPVSAQHGQDGHATQSAAVLLLFARSANNTVLILDKFLEPDRSAIVKSERQHHLESPPVAAHTLPSP